MAITLGLVEAVDATGVYVSMPGARGVLRGPYETLQNVTAGDKVLMVTTDDGDNVIVGLAGASVPGVTIADGSITSAKIANGTIVDEDINASAAIAKTKISGTAITAADSGTVTNAMLAGSIAASKITGTAITAADSGTVTSTMIANSTIVDGDISGSAAISRSKISGLPTSSTDNTLPKFDSTGGALQTSGIVVDDNNRLRVASGSSGGLEIGSSGVLTLSNTGDPSGVSAPVGSTWRQTDANSTYGNLAGLLWVKVGTGTTLGTDWLVDYEGRWVSYTPTMIGATTNPTITTKDGRYTRAGKTCWYKFRFVTWTAAGSGTYYVPLPVNANTTQPWASGNAYIYDASSGNGYNGFVYIGAATYMGMIYPLPSGSSGYVASSAPWGWTTSDEISGQVTYEIA